MRVIAGSMIAGTLIAGLCVPAVAQSVVDRTLVLHPNDIITWTPAPDHKLMFGAQGLTKFKTVATFLKFEAGQMTCGADSASCTSVGEIKATVRDDIDLSTAGVVAFNFTCGFHPDMVSSPFTIEPAPIPIPPAVAPPPREINITTDADFHWIFEDGTILNRDSEVH